MSKHDRAHTEPPSPTLVGQIESICDRFEDACRSGDSPRIEAFWDSAEGSGELLRELLLLELVYRVRDGERPDIDEYLARLPEHQPTVHDAFAAARDGGLTVGPPASGVNTLVPEGASVPVLEAVSDGTPWSLHAVPDGCDEEHIADALTRAGYEVMGELGRGGMGIVYEARQTALGRTVALKVLRSGLFATDEECRRLLHEAEAVARLEHPGIVPVYEVRRSRGLVFFSMRRVRGSSLDHRLKQGPLAPQDAARLVARTARAVDHAHRHGILHRDLKPANLLVGEEDGPFVTDFGLARRLDRADGVDLTRTGAVIGTPGYMAPEQAEGKSGALTTATDVYGLGGILYAALTGVAPHAASSLAEILDRVRTESPEPPSRINSQVPRDLEIICLKCLEKDPQRRYGSALELAADLDRWAAGEPIVARPVSTLRRACMWARRRPLPAALLAGLVASVVIGLCGIGWQWHEANRQRLEAERLLDYLANRLLAQASTEVNPQGANLTVRALLDRQAARIGGEFQGQPEFEAPLREVIGNAYHSLGVLDPAEQQLRLALKLSDGLHGRSAPASIRIATSLGRVIAAQGHLDEARSLLTQIQGTALRVLGRDDPGTVEATARLGTVLLALHRASDAAPLLRQALADRRRLLAADHPDTLRSVHDLCRLAMDTGSLDEAERLAHEYEYGIRCARGSSHPDNVIALANRGLIQRLQGHPAAARPFYQRAADEARRILGPEHPATRAAEREYAALLENLEKPKANSPAAP